MKRVAIFISGGGSNMLRLVDSMTGDHPARPVLVLSNRADAGGIAAAAARVSTPSFSKTCSRCLFTVRGLIPRISLMTRLGLP